MILKMFQIIYLGNRFKTLNTNFKASKDTFSYKCPASYRLSAMLTNVVSSFTPPNVETPLRLQWEAHIIKTVYN